mmetsp:Transcript_23924/g.59625  ORF Transcript_23924/g.59625 Transcript_23924/m.59625 type:complete len:182 (-) Transcript_23924:277-822(-)
MEVALEKIPQDAALGPMQIVHWAIRVGKGPESVCYEFESEGVQIGEHTTCDHGFKIDAQRLGVTSRTHDEIHKWVMQFGKKNAYHVAGGDFGGKNCQDFVVDLCSFLGVDASQLPWRQARQVEVAVGGAVVAAGILAVTGGLLARLLCPGQKPDETLEVKVQHPVGQSESEARRRHEQARS